MRALGFLLLIPIVLSAGCFGGNKGSPDDVQDPTDSENPGQDPGNDPGGSSPLVPEVQELYMNGTVTADAFNLVEVSEPATLRLPFEVTANTTRVVLELSWTSVQSVQDFDVALSTGGVNCVVGYALCADRAKIALGQPTSGWYQNRGGNQASPDAPSILEFDADALEAMNCSQSCTWAAWVQTHSPVSADAFVSLKVTIEG